MEIFVNELRADRERTMAREREEGREEGVKEGREESKRGIIKVLFKNKMTAKEIAEKTGIKLVEVLKILDDC